jgi:site-specific recombinase XerD
VEVEPPPFFLFFAAQLLEVVKNALAANTLRSYRTSLRILSAFHKMRLDEITVLEIESFRAKRFATGRLLSTVNRDLSFLRLVLQAAVRQNLIPTSPFLRRQIKLQRGRVSQNDT